MTDRPSKLYFTISDVAALTDVKPHVLRYWESEFPTLRPRKTKSGSRRYRQRDIDEILAIKKLLYEEGFRISGARKIRRQAHAAAQAEEVLAKPQIALPIGDQDPLAQMAYVRGEIVQILALLKELGAECATLRPDPDKDDGPKKEAEAEA